METWPAPNREPASGFQRGLLRAQVDQMMAAAGADQWLSVNDVCGILGVTRNTVSKLIAGGHLECIRLPLGGRGRLRITRESLARYLSDARAS